VILAKNYRTVSKFVKVMPRILWPLFFLGHGVYVLYCYCYYSALTMLVRWRERHPIHVHFCFRTPSRYCHCG